MSLEKKFQEDTGWVKEIDDGLRFKFTAPNGITYELNEVQKGAFKYYFAYANWLEQKNLELVDEIKTLT